MRRISNNRNIVIFNNRFIKKIIPSYMIILIMLFGIVLSVSVIVRSATIEIPTDNVKQTSVSNDYPDLSTDVPSSSDDETYTDLKSTTSSNDYSKSDLTISSSSDNYYYPNSNNSSSSVNYSDSFYNNNSDYTNETLIDNISIKFYNETMVFNLPTLNERIVPIEEIVTVTENNFGNLSIDQEIELITNNSMDIDSIKLAASNELKDVKIKIIKLKDKPEVVTEPQKKNESIYKFLDIKLTANEKYVEESEIKSLTFRFNVEYKWINDNNIDKLTIKLIRYHDGEWQNLPTILKDEDETYIYYDAESVGCSTFAIVGSKVIEKQESTISEETSVPWFIIIIVIVSLTAILIAVLIKARYIYVEETSPDD